MNRQDTRTQQPNPRPTRQAPVGRPPEARRKKPDPALLRVLRGLMLIVAGMITLVGLLLIILPSFRVQKIEVEGNSYYSDEAIMEAAGIEIGQEILAIDIDAVNNGIWKLSYVESTKIVRSLNSVRIIVTERQNVMYTEFNGKFFSLDRDLHVIEKSENEEAFAGFLKVQLPEIASLSVGGTLQFEKADVDRSYITELIDTLQERGILSSVSSLDFSKKYSVSYVLLNRCRVELGKVSQMDTKLAIVEQILTQKGGADAAMSVVDVSDLQKPTYRVLGGSEVLLGGTS